MSYNPDQERDERGRFAGSGGYSNQWGKEPWGSLPGGQMVHLAHRERAATIKTAGSRASGDKKVGMRKIGRLRTALRKIGHAVNAAHEIAGQMGSDILGGMGL